MADTQEPGAGSKVLEDVIEVSSPSLEGVTVEIRRDPRNPPPPEAEEAAISEAVELLRTAIAEAGGDATAEITVEETVTVAVQQEVTTTTEQAKHVKDFIRATDLVGYPPPIKEGGPMASLHEEGGQLLGQAMPPPAQAVAQEARQMAVPPQQASRTREEETVLEVTPEPRETDLLNETLELQDDSKRSTFLQRFFGPCMEDHYPRLPPDASFDQRVFRSCLCPPHGPIGNAISGILIMALVWGLALVIFREEAQPGHEVFAVLAMLTSAMAGGYLFKIIQLPSLVGMLLVGLAWRNANISELVDMESQISDKTSFFFRNCALAVIILRAGMALNPEILQRDWPIILRLGLIPCTLEALAWSATANLILNLPWIWAFLLGTVISAASSAVLIPAMLHFQEIGLGTDKGVPTITMAATSIDNVLALSLFGLLHSIAFSEGSIAHSLAHVPSQMAVGIGFGLVWGLLMRYFPSPDMRKGYVLTGRIFMMLGGAFLAVFGGTWYDYAGAGSLACLILAYIASVSWRQKSGWGRNRPDPVAGVLNGLWVFLEPMLFALIGSEIALKDLNGRIVGYGVLCMFICLLVRWIITVISVKGIELSWKECFFVAISWLPKATIQAALGPVIWATARRIKAGPEMEDFGHAVMSLAALSILITAPLGALAIKFSGPSLLNKAPKKLEGEAVPGETYTADPVVDTTV